MNCEKCNKEHRGTYGSGRFCSSKCAHSRIITDEWKSRIKRVLTTRLLVKKTCSECKNLFETKKESQKYCSKSCAAINTAKVTLEQKRVWVRNSTIKRYAAGDSSIGWKTRSKSFMSYPEKYFTQVFKSWSPKYNFNVGKYFIDFAFIDKMIAVEIDGRRHDDKDIKTKDNTRTKFLESKGWNVLRIKWINPINELDRNRLKHQIDSVTKMLV